MRKIATVSYTNSVPDEVLAQAVAGAAGWHRDEVGAIYAQDEVFVASSLTEAAIAMQHLGWITARGAVATGVAWSRIDKAVSDAYDVPRGEVPPRKYCAGLVRAAVRAIR